MPRSKLRLTVVALVLAAVVLLVDAVSKALVRADAADLPHRLVGGVRIDLYYNSGISFSRFAGSQLVTAAVAAVAAAVAVALFTVPARFRPALGLVLGGALGNLIDRLRFGAVVDFIGIYSWPTFNLADVFIVVGTAIIVLQILRGARA